MKSREEEEVEQRLSAFNSTRMSGHGCCNSVAMETDSRGASRAAGSEASPLFWAGLSMLKSPFQMTVRSTGRLLISIPSYKYCSHGNRVRKRETHIY